MNSVVTLAILLLCGAVVYFYTDANQARQGRDRYIAIIESQKAHKENNDRFDQIDKDLQNVEDDDLSPAMRDAAGKLWP